MGRGERWLEFSKGWAKHSVQAQLSYLLLHEFFFSTFNNIFGENSLVTQWLGLQVWVLFLVGELRLHKPQDTAKRKKKKKNRFGEFSWFYICFGGMFSIQIRQSEDFIVSTPSSGMCDTDRPVTSLTGNPVCGGGIVVFVLLLFLSFC